MTYKILITEDDKVTALFMQRVVTQMGHESVGIAYSGSEAIDLVQSTKVDLVLMDISLPGKLDGISVTNQIMEEHGLPVVYITGVSDKDTLSRALKTHPYGYISKPVTEGVLQTVIELSMQRFNLEKELIQSQHLLQQLNINLEEKVKERTIELKSKNFDLNKEVGKRKKSEAQLKVSLAKERELNELKSRIVNIISHEIKTPLTSIKSSAELIDLHIENQSPPEKINKHIKSIDKSVNALTTIINETLLIGKIESGSLIPEIEPTHIREMITEIIDTIESGIGKNHSVLLEVGAEVPTLFKTDKRLFTQIFTNLLSNATKYSPEAEVVEVKFNVDSEYLHFSVIDYGLGIPEKDQKYLFEMFHRASNTSNIEGVGLGLAIVKKSIEELGGSLEFTSAENQGTTFIVSLPLN
ncbi:MAG: signal transduction histidine kinase [Salibacteraceae bacterium]|jgi:signal transduction histidine kinase